jgi:hypothetical protein
MLMLCAMCTEDIAPGEEHQSGINFVAHRECLLRDVVGGIGHLIAHDYWCTEKGDPDAGLTRRQSSLLVDAWVHIMGVEAAVER